MNISENLKFQKENFKSVYNGYLKGNDSEIAIAKEPINYEEEKNIQIITESIVDILINVFKIPRYIINNIELDNYDEIYLVKDINPAVEDYGKILEIRYLYPYILKVEKIVITKKVRKLKENNLIKIYNLKRLDIFEKKYLKNIDYKVEYIKDLDELCNNLMSLKPEYRLDRLFLNKSKKEKLEETEYIIDEDYKEMIIGDLVKIVINSQEDDPKEVVNKLIKFTYGKYKNNSLHIIKNFINDDFLNNFKIVDIYMENEEQLKNLLNNKFIKDLEKYIKQIKELKKSEQIALLVNGEVKKINDILVMVLSNLVNDLSRVGDE